MSMLAKTATGLELLLSIGALGGGAALMMGPHGEIMPLPTEALAASVFVDYFVPGLVLFVVLGVVPLGVAVLAWRGSALAPFLTFSVGIALLVWIGIEIAVIGFAWIPPLQPFYAVLGGAITVIGGGWVVTSRAPRAST